MPPFSFWQNSIPFICKAAFSIIKIDDFSLGLNSKLVSLSRCEELGLCLQTKLFACLIKLWMGI
jgi:hypothetical protein